MANDAPQFVEWPQFLARFDWRQGEHAGLIGPTGQGKSTLARAILPRRSYVAAFGTKPKDDTLRGMQREEHYRRIQKWPPPRGAHRVLLWPTMRRPEDEHTQHEVFYDALGDIFAAGHWCCYFDELQYLTETLGLHRRVAQFFQQGRSLRISVVACVQRPAFVPRVMYTSVTHLFLWRTNDANDAKSLSGLGIADSDRIKSTVAQLPKFAVLYVNTRTGELAITRVSRGR